MPISLPTVTPPDHDRVLFDATPDPILVTDGEGRCLDANSAALALLGYTRDEILQCHVRDISLREPTASAEEFTRLKQEDVWRGESRLRRKDGSVVETESQAVQVELPEGTRYIGTFRDMTERHRAEATLRASEARLRALLAQVPVGIGLTDAHGRWVLTNARMTRFIGEVMPSLEPRQIDRWQVWDADGGVLDPADWPEARALRGETVAGVVALFTSEGDAPCWILVNAAPLRTETGEVAGVIAVYQDIDAHKRAEDALLAREERYRTLAHASANTVWRANASGEHVIEVDGSDLRPYDPGLTPVPEWLESNVHQDDQTATWAAWQQAVATRSVYDHIHRLRTVDDAYCWIRSRAVPLLDERGAVREWIGTSTDITERKEAALATARLAAIVETSQDAIISETLEGTILDWNAGAEALYGYPAAEVVGRDVRLLVPPELGHDPVEVFARLGRGEAVPPLETVHLRQDGTRVAVELRLSPLRDADGRVIGISAIARDITKRKHLEQFRQDILDIASHDLRTPLAVISMRAQVLQSRQAYDAPGVHVIREQAQRMARLIDDLGDVVQLEAGQLALKPEAVDLHVVACEAVARAQMQTARHHINVETSETPVIGHWDHARLEEVIDNLLGNAIKYSPQGGAIVVQVEATDEEAQLRVTDQGIGIPAEMLPRLFERLQRGEGTGIAGLGLGLYITRMLVEAHGGRITVQSVLGEGATFTVWLPLERTA